MKRKLVPVLGVLSIAILLSGWACLTGSAYHKANRASKQIADDIHEFAKDVTTMCAPTAGHCTGSISDEEAKSLAGWAGQASLVSDQFNVQLKQAGTLNGSNSQQLLQAFNNLSVSVNQLEASGVLHLKSATAQKTFSEVYATIQSAVVLLQGIIANPPTSENRPMDAPLRSGADPVGLALMAFVSLLKLIGQWKADGTLTDEQLQDAVSAENEDTRATVTDLISQLSPPQA